MSLLNHSWKGKDLLSGSDVHLLGECLGPLLPVYNLGIAESLLLPVHGEVFLCCHLCCGARVLKLPVESSFPWTSLYTGAEGLGFTAGATVACPERLN